MAGRRYTRGMVKDTRVHVHMRIDFAGGASVGPGKIALLERIVVAGSLSQAARDLGLSYRRGWLLLNDLNQSFGEPVVVTATGGAHGDDGGEEPSHAADHVGEPGHVRL